MHLHQGYTQQQRSSEHVPQQEPALAAVKTKRASFTVVPPRPSLAQVPEAEVVLVCACAMHACMFFFSQIGCTQEQPASMQVALVPEVENSKDAAEDSANKSTAQRQSHVIKRTQSGCLFLLSACWRSISLARSSQSQLCGAKAEQQGTSADGLCPANTCDTYDLHDFTM